MPITSHLILCAKLFCTLMIAAIFVGGSNTVGSGASGTDLGLYFAKKIAELHGGKLWMKSQENQGTTMFVRLPIVKK